MSTFSYSLPTPGGTVSEMLLCRFSNFFWWPEWPAGWVPFVQGIFWCPNGSHGEWRRSRLGPGNCLPGVPVLVGWWYILSCHPPGFRHATNTLLPCHPHHHCEDCVPFCGPPSHRGVVGDCGSRICSYGRVGGLQQGGWEHWQLPRPSKATCTRCRLLP